jgi:hypothetical protein
VDLLPEGESEDLGHGQKPSEAKEEATPVVSRRASLEGNHSSVHSDPDSDRWKVLYKSHNKTLVALNLITSLVLVSLSLKRSA